MKKIMFSLIMLSLAFTLGQDKMYIWENSAITDSMDLANDLKISFKSETNTCDSSTIYYEGKTYHTVQIGAQCWLKENLDVGTMIEGSADPSNNTTIEKYCYDNNEANCTTYGGLYNWNEAMQYVTAQGTQGICPTGWHIPTYAELLILTSAVENNSNTLKAIGQGSGSGVGTNTSGFSALVAGNRLYGGTFQNLNYLTGFWSSTDDGDATMTYYTYLLATNSNITPYYANKRNGFSVRCLKN